MSETAAISGNVNMPTDQKPPLPEPLSRAERVRALRGKYAWIPFSSDDLAREKQKEIEREGR
jgi:hypothetical protein